MSFATKIYRFTSPKVLGCNFAGKFSTRITTQKASPGQINDVNLLALRLASVNIDNSWIWQQKDKIKLPVISKVQIDLPNNLTWVPPLIEPDNNKTEPVEAPTTEANNDVVKEAITMLVIRRKKMKKHKLKKLRKKMKYEWAKLRQRRELRKEKAFQAELIQQCKNGEAFSAEEYVQEKIDKLNEVIIPRYWKGKRLPEFIIREKMGLPPKK